MTATWSTLDNDWEGYFNLRAAVDQYQTDLYKKWSDPMAFMKTLQSDGTACLNSIANTSFESEMGTQLAAAVAMNNYTISCGVNLPTTTFHGGDKGDITFEAGTAVVNFSQLSPDGTGIQISYTHVHNDTGGEYDGYDIGSLLISANNPGQLDWKGIGSSGLYGPHSDNAGVTWMPASTNTDQSLTDYGNWVDQQIGMDGDGNFIINGDVTKTFNGIQIQIIANPATVTISGTIPLSDVVSTTITIPPAPNLIDKFITQYNLQSPSTFLKYYATSAKWICSYATSSTPNPFVNQNIEQLNQCQTAEDILAHFSSQFSPQRNGGPYGMDIYAQNPDLYTVNYNPQNSPCLSLVHNKFSSFPQDELPNCYRDPTYADLVYKAALDMLQLLKIYNPPEPIQLWNDFLAAFSDSAASALSDLGAVGALATSVYEGGGYNLDSGYVTDYCNITGAQLD